MRWCFRIMVLTLLIAGSVEAYGHEWTERECMAMNLYYEARGEGTPGMIAVANVVLRRVESDAFPATVCGVVRQRKQFSWYRAGAHYSPQPQLYRTALLIAEKMLSTWRHISYLDGALYYMNPDKASGRGKRFFAKLTKVGQIGNHHFYK